jgi:hypothetical protein
MTLDSRDYRDPMKVLIGREDHEDWRKHGNCRECAHHIQPMFMGMTLYRCEKLKPYGSKDCWKYEKKESK